MHSKLLDPTDSPPIDSLIKVDRLDLIGIEDLNCIFNVVVDVVNILETETIWIVCLVEHKYLEENKRIFKIFDFLE